VNGSQLGRRQQAPAGGHRDEAFGGAGQATGWRMTHRGLNNCWYSSSSVSSRKPCGGGSRRWSSRGCAVLAWLASCHASRAAGSARAGRQAGLVRARGRDGQPDQPAPSHRGCTEAVTECAPPAAEWEDWHGAAASDAACGSGLCTSGVIMSQGFPVSPRRDWIWLSRSCTCRGLVMYLSCARPIPAPRESVQDECLTMMGVHAGGPRPTNCACQGYLPDQHLCSWRYPGWAWVR
jgi:hypothetical protein